MKFHTKLSCSGRNHTILLLMLVVETVLLLLVISLTAQMTQVVNEFPHLFILHIQYHGCCCAEMRKGIGSFNIDLETVIPVMDIAFLHIFPGYITATTLFTQMPGNLGEDWWIDHVIPPRMGNATTTKHNTTNTMTSSNGNIFRFTGHLCGEFIGDRWIPHTKARDAELWCFLWSAPE